MRKVANFVMQAQLEPLEVAELKGLLTKTKTYVEFKGLAQRLGLDSENSPTTFKLLSTIDDAIDPQWLDTKDRSIGWASSIRLVGDILEAELAVVTELKTL